KSNPNQTIIFQADIETNEHHILQEYFKIKQINVINMTFTECLEIDKLVKECVSDTLIKQNNLQGIISISSSHPHLNVDEKRIVTINNTEKRRL
nr:hypothetical protein [Bacillus pacificus]